MSEIEKLPFLVVRVPQGVKPRYNTIIAVNKDYVAYDITVYKENVNNIVHISGNIICEDGLDRLILIKGFDNGCYLINSHDWDIVG